MDSGEAEQQATDLCLGSFASLSSARADSDSSESFDRDESSELSADSGSGVVNAVNINSIAANQF